MQVDTVTHACIVVNPNMSWVGVLPDRKVVDSQVGYGLIEVNCSYSNKDIAPHVACVSAKHFCMELMENRSRLKRTCVY